MLRNGMVKNEVKERIKNALSALKCLKLGRIKIFIISYAIKKGEPCIGVISNLASPHLTEIFGVVRGLGNINREAMAEAQRKGILLFITKPVEFIMEACKKIASGIQIPSKAFGVWIAMDSISFSLKPA